MKKNRFLFFSFCFLILFSLFSCATSGNIAGNGETENETTGKTCLPSESEISWKKIDGIPFAEYFYFENKYYPVRWHCVKINLECEKLTVVTYPASENDFDRRIGQKSGILKGITIKKFSEMSHALICVNTTPFERHSYFSSDRKISGLHSAEKKILSPPVAKYSAVCFSKNPEDTGYTAKILKSQKNQDYSSYDFSFGGFFQILTDGKKEEFKAASNDSRTAMGVSKDGKTLYLLVVEGEKQKYSRGLSFQECADIFIRLGADNALQMDGGGSASLFINGENVLSYRKFRKNAAFAGFGVCADSD